jgi:enoyl-CoA hydratase/carnithine racemase
VLVVEFHTNGGPFRFTAQDHTEFVDAFYRIGQDRANKIVILTGAGGEFIPEIDFSSFGNVADPGRSGRLEPGSRRRRSAPRKDCQYTRTGHRG